MNKTSTTENLILYLYNETAMTESVLIQRDIDYDPETECEFENLKATIALLENSLVSPSETSIRKIMTYAGQTN